MSVSIVIPVLDDAPALRALLAQIQAVGDPMPELIVVDGGSSDGAARAAREAGAIFIDSIANRGAQLNAGVLHAAGEWIWMLHADSRISPVLLEFIQSLQVPAWGRFDVRFEPGGSAMSLVSASMNWRSRCSGVCTGDQGLFVHRSLLEAVGGVPEQPLMEDIELTRRLKRLCRPICPRLPIATSARRWYRDGIVKTILTMWGLRLRYWWGADPAVLARAYYA